jgi:hypothetical protein
MAGGYPASALLCRLGPDASQAALAQLQASGWHESLAAVRSQLEDFGPAFQRAFGVAEDAGLGSFDAEELKTKRILGAASGSEADQHAAELIERPPALAVVSLHRKNDFLIRSQLGTVGNIGAAGVAAFLVKIVETEKSPCTSSERRF